MSQFTTHPECILLVVPSMHWHDYDFNLDFNFDNDFGYAMAVWVSTFNIAIIAVRTEL